MPSLFAELETKVSAAIDGLYGEIVIIKKMIKGEFSGRRAAGSTPLAIVGIVDINPIVTNLGDLNGNDGLVPMMPGETIHISFDLSLFPDAVSVPVQYDHIVTERTEWRELSVEFIKPDGIGRIVCVCKRASS